METVKGFFRLHTAQKIPKKHGFQRKAYRDPALKLYYPVQIYMAMI
ncbi:hypothetical protein M2408_003451 [Sphingobacterium sp. BIGb0165]|nr:hypothetical protein [Sphingobacterium sp. BIGb0165]